jgi:hypothetical protein
MKRGKIDECYRPKREQKYVKMVVHHLGKCLCLDGSLMEKHVFSRRYCSLDEEHFVVMSIMGIR